jgi:hypothetical protein
MINTPVPADCLKSFDTARKASHAPSNDIIIAARILNPFMHGYERTWNVLEKEGIPRHAAKELYLRVRRYLNGSNSNDTYKSLVGDIRTLFSDAHDILQKRWETYADIPEPDYLSVQTGYHFMRSLDETASSNEGNLIQLSKANPFLMVHVAAEFLHDLDGDISARHDRKYLWDTKTELYDRMNGYCHDLHNLVPFGLEPKDASEDQFQITMASMRYLYGMLTLSEEASVYSYLVDLKRDFAILKSYIEPFGLPPKIEPAKENAATLLDWDKWVPLVQDARIKRAERRAAMPPSFFPE